MRLRLSKASFGFAALNGGTVGYASYIVIGSFLTQAVDGSLSLSGAIGALFGGLVVAGFGIVLLVGIPILLGSVLLSGCLLAGVQIAGRTSARMLGGCGAVAGLFVGGGLEVSVGPIGGPGLPILLATGVLTGLLSGLVIWAVADARSSPTI